MDGERTDWSSTTDDAYDSGTKSIGAERDDGRRKIDTEQVDRGSKIGAPVTSPVKEL